MGIDIEFREPEWVREWFGHIDIEREYSAKEMAAISQTIVEVVNFDSNKKYNFTDYISLYSSHPLDAIKEMEMFIKYFEYRKGYKIRHFCFDVSRVNEGFIADGCFGKALRMALKQSFKKYPIVADLHENADIPHIHFAVCTFNTDGERLNLSDEYLSEIKYYFAKNLELYFYGSNLKLYLLK